MNRSGQITLTLCVLCLASMTVAQTPGSAPSGQATPTIVTVSFNEAVLATTEAQRDLGALRTKFGPRELQLQKLNDAIEAEKKQLSDGAIKLSDSERNARIQDLNSKDKQLQREAEDFKNDSQSESQQVFQRIAQKLYALLQEYSQQHGYSAVIERGTDSAPVVWYAASNVDITEQIAKAYDLKSGIAPSNLPAAPSSDSHNQNSPARPPSAKPSPR
jgi:outer membrane protein